MQRFLQQKTFRLWYVLALTVGAAIAIVAGISSQATKFPAIAGRRLSVRLSAISGKATPATVAANRRQILALSNSGRCGRQRVLDPVWTLVFKDR